MPDIKKLIKHLTTLFIVCY